MAADMGVEYREITDWEWIGPDGLTDRQRAEQSYNPPFECTCKCLRCDLIQHDCGKPGCQGPKSVEKRKKQKNS